MQADIRLLIHSRAHQRWIGFSEDDDSSPTAQGNQAAKPQLFANALRTTRSTLSRQKSSQRARG
jgi:hypothetical protein